MHSIHTRVSELFNIRYPIIQAGMVWTSGYKLAAAAANAGALGLIGAGSMYPDILRTHIQKAKLAVKDSDGVLGVNVPLLYPDIDQLMQILVDESVKIVFTSAGNPATWTPFLKDHGIKVVHVVPSARFAVKAARAGCDAVVAEGFEAGGHNGRDETTTMVLVPLVVAEVGSEIPVIAAGGIATGGAMAAAFALGASGVQVGSRFAVTREASCHPDFKERVVASTEGETRLAMKKHVPVRLLENSFQKDVLAAEAAGASVEELRQLLGRARAKRGIFEGDLEEGELEIGQVAALINDVPSAAEVVQRMVTEYFVSVERLPR